MKRNQIVWSHEMLMQNSEEEDKGGEEMGFGDLGVSKDPRENDQKKAVRDMKRNSKVKERGRRTRRRKTNSAQHTVWSHTLSLSISISILEKRETFWIEADF